jgi:glycine/sarcosine N-methyltransferase
MDFYSALAPDYDVMTRFSERLGTEEALLREWIDPRKTRAALDAACGTGLHAILLAKMGLAVTGADLSPDMIKTAAANADAQNVKVTWIAADMRKLKKTIRGGFDAVLCLGNSLPHLLTEKDLTAALDGFYRLLNPGGFLLVQQLNYDGILKKKERIIGVNRKEGKEFIRFYDFARPYLHFNILTVAENRGKLEHALSSTPLRPWRKRELLSAITGSGFKKTVCLGSMDRQPFKTGTSANLVIQAFKIKTERK